MYNFDCEPHNILFLQTFLAISRNVAPSLKQWDIGRILKFLTLFVSHTNQKGNNGACDYILYLLCIYMLPLLFQSVRLLALLGRFHLKQHRLF